MVSNKIFVVVRKVCNTTSLHLKHSLLPLETQDSFKGVPHTSIQKKKIEACSGVCLKKKTNILFPEDFCSLFHLTCYLDERTFTFALSSFKLVIWTNEPLPLLYHLLNSLFQQTNLHYCFIIFLNSLFRRTNLR